MLRTTHRPSSGARKTVIAASGFTCFWLPAAAMAGPSQRPAQSHLIGSFYEIFELYCISGFSILRIKATNLLIFCTL